MGGGGAIKNPYRVVPASLERVQDKRNMADLNGQEVTSSRSRARKDELSARRCVLPERGAYGDCSEKDFLPRNETCEGDGVGCEP